jgi:hypothetical protein
MTQPAYKDLGVLQYETVSMDSSTIIRDHSTDQYCTACDDASPPAELMVAQPQLRTQTHRVTFNLMVQMQTKTSLSLGNIVSAAAALRPVTHVCVLSHIRKTHTDQDWKASSSMPVAVPVLPMEESTTVINTEMT